MKNITIKICTLIVFLCTISFHIKAQSPEAFNYQAMALNSSNTVLKNQAISLQISLLEGSQNGTAVYVETQSTTTSTHGLFSIQIGNGVVQSGAFSDADWAANEYWIKIEADFAGGNNFAKVGTSKMVSVPYAMHAMTAENVDDADADATNEIQTFSRNGNTILLSKNGGSFTDNVDDPDNDPLNELQLLTKAGNQIILSHGGGQYTDEVNDADADATNEIQIMSINGNKISLSNGGGTVDLPMGTVDTDDQKLSLNDTKLTIEDGNTVDLFNLSSPWIRVPQSNIIDFEDENGVLARISDDNHTLNLSQDQINYKDTSECRTHLVNGALHYTREVTVSPDLQFIYQIAGFNKDSIYFEDYNQDPDYISRSQMSKDQVYLYDKIAGDEYVGSLEPYQMNLRINDEAWGNYDAFGLQARTVGAAGISKDWELDLKAGFGLFMAEDDGNNGSNATLSNNFGMQIGKGIGFGVMSEVHTELNRDSLKFDYILDNGLQSGFAHYGRDELSMNYQAGALTNSSSMSPYNIWLESDLAGDKILMNMTYDNVEFVNPLGGHSFTHVGLDSIYMSKYIGLLFPEDVTLKPNLLKFEDQWNVSNFNSFRFQIKSILSPSDIYTRVNLDQEALTMYNEAKWRNTRLGTMPGGNAGQLDIWTGTGDFKLAELGRDNLDGLSGSLQLFSNNSGAHASAWLRVRQGHGVLELEGPNTFNVLIGARDKEGGLVQVYNAIGNGEASASLYADIHNRGVVQGDNIVAGGHMGDDAIYPMTTIQTAQYGMNIATQNQVDNWEFFISDSHMNLYANSNLVGRFNSATGAYTALSDRKFKTNIQVMDALMPSLMLMKPSKYQYINNNPNQKESLGFIAQDIQKLFPELVLKGASKTGEEILTVDYSGFGVIAIKAIQEQQVTIENQNAKIQKLENDMNEMKAMIKKLMK